MKKISKLHKALRFIGLKKEADYLEDLILKLAQSSEDKKILSNTAKYFNNLAKNLNALKRSAERRGNSSEVERFDNLRQIAASLYNSSMDGDFASLDKLFRDGTPESKLSLAIDPDYGSPLLNKDSFGQEVGRDMGILSLVPQTMPIKHAPKEYFDGMEYGIKDSILTLISSQQGHHRYMTANYSSSFESQKTDLLSELKSFEDLMAIRQDPSNPENYGTRSVRGRDREWYEETISNVISPEEASRKIEEKREEVNKKIKQLTIPSFSPDLTSEQLYWVKRLNIKF